MRRLAAFLAASLLCHAAYADNSRSPRCQSVSECVKLAEKTSARFSPTLRQGLKALSGAVLIEGLEFKHSRPAVTELVRQHLHVALTHQDGHTRASAERLLQLAQIEKDTALQDRWIDLLASDKAGREVLVAFIERTKTDRLRLKAMLSCMSGSTDQPKVEADDELERPLPLQKSQSDASVSRPRELQPIEARYVGEVWSTWLALRKNESDTTGEWLLYQIRGEKIYAGRLKEFLRAQVAAGEVPLWPEMSALGRLAARDRVLFREMLRWSESSNMMLARRASRSLLGSLDSQFAFSREELPAVRRMLIAGALDPENPSQSSYPYFLLSYLDGLSAEEAKQIVRVAQEAPRTNRETANSRYRSELLIRIAQIYPEHRAPVIERLLNSDLEDAEELVYSQKEVPWLTAFATSWVKELKPDELRDEAIQERFVVLSQLLERDIRFRLNLPTTRRAHIESPGFVGCGSGTMEAYFDEETARGDLAAFGLSPSEKAPSEQVPMNDRPKALEDRKVPAAPPMTPQEATVRWQQFVMARDAVLRHMAKNDPKL